MTITTIGGECMTQELLFNDLVSAVRSELLRVNYKEQRIKIYEPIWEALGNYLEKTDRKRFDMKVGLSFLKEEYGITTFDHLKSPSMIKVRGCNELEIGYEFTVKAELSHLFAIFFRHIQNQLEESETCKSKQEEHVKTMIEYINRNFSERIFIEEIAAAANISLRECYRCFKDTWEQRLLYIWKIIACGRL